MKFGDSPDVTELKKIKNEDWKISFGSEHFKFYFIFMNIWLISTENLRRNRTENTCFSYD